MGLFNKVKNTAKGNGGLGTFSPLGMVGSNPLTKALGLSGDQGDFYSPETAARNEYAKFATNYDKEYNDQVGNIQNGALTKDLFGTGGLQSRLNTEEQNLAGQGYQLTQGDREAYGQAAGDIERQFGAQENDVMANLQKRGLASAGSGAAGAAFSGLGGNKNEMLAKAQTQIADQRMNNTMQRLNATRSQMQSLGVAGANMAGDRVNQKGQLLSTAAGNESQLGQERLMSLEDQRAAKGKTLLEGFGSGLFSSSANVGAAPGKFVSSAAGSAGSGAGKMFSGGMG